MLRSKAAKQRDATGQPGEAGDAAGGGSAWKEQKRRRNRLGALPGRRDKLIAAIQLAETRKKAIADRFAQSAFLDGASKDDARGLEREDAELTARIVGWMQEWEAIEREIAALGGEAAGGP